MLPVVLDNFKNLSTHYSHTSQIQTDEIMDARTYAQTPEQKAGSSKIKLNRE